MTLIHHLIKLNHLPLRIAIIFLLHLSMFFNFLQSHLLLNPNDDNLNLQILSQHPLSRLPSDSNASKMTTKPPCNNLNEDPNQQSYGLRRILQYDDTPPDQEGSLSIFRNINIRTPPNQVDKEPNISDQTITENPLAPHLNEQHEVRHNNKTEEKKDFITNDEQQRTNQQLANESSEHPQPTFTNPLVDEEKKAQTVSDASLPVAELSPQNGSNKTSIGRVQADNWFPIDKNTFKALYNNNLIKFDQQRAEEGIKQIPVRVLLENLYRAGHKIPSWHQVNYNAPAYLDRKLNPLILNSLKRSKSRMPTVYYSPYLYPPTTHHRQYNLPNTNRLNHGYPTRKQTGGLLNSLVQKAKMNSILPALLGLSSFGSDNSVMMQQNDRTSKKNLDSSESSMLGAVDFGEAPADLVNPLVHQLTSGGGASHYSDYQNLHDTHLDNPSIQTVTTPDSPTFEFTSPNPTTDEVILQSLAGNMPNFVRSRARPVKPIPLHSGMSDESSLPLEISEKLLNNKRPGKSQNNSRQKKPLDSEQSQSENDNEQDANNNNTSSKVPANEQQASSEDDEQQYEYVPLPPRRHRNKQRRRKNNSPYYDPRGKPGRPQIKVRKRPRGHGGDFPHQATSSSRNNPTFHQIDSPNDLQPAATLLRWKYPWLYRDMDDDEEDGETELNIRFFNNFSRSGPLSGLARSAGTATLIISLAFLILSNVSLAVTVIAHGISSFLRAAAQNNQNLQLGRPKNLYKHSFRESTVLGNFLDPSRPLSFFGKRSITTTTTTTKAPSTSLDERISKLGNVWSINKVN